MFKVKSRKLESEKLFGSNRYIEGANAKNTLVKFL